MPLYPEVGNAVYCTEVTVSGEEISAYLTVHSGQFLDWKCVMMKSYDNGHTWKNAGSPPHFPEYTFLRGTITTSNGSIVTPYQYYPITKEERDKVFYEQKGKGVWSTNSSYCESGTIVSSDGGKTYTRHTACRMYMKNIEVNGTRVNPSWIWSEPTIVELLDGTIVMLMRRDGGGWLWRCDSHDGGKTWSECLKTNIPNPGNKPKLLKLDNGKIALIHTPCASQRYPLSLWISDDGMKTWKDKTILTDFPGQYSYADGFYENGHIKFSIEHNRHTTLLFDIEID